MMNFSRKKLWPLGIFFVAVFLLMGSYFLRQKAYALNRNVRLVSMRLLRYRELSLHRGCVYKIRFEKNGYRVFVFHRNRTGEWLLNEAHFYVDDIRVATPDFTVEFDTGRLDAYYIGEKKTKLRPFLTLYFFHEREPDRRKGIWFGETGIWRAL